MQHGVETHSGLFGQNRASTSLFKHGSKLNRASASGSMSREHVYMASQNYESKYDTQRGNVSAGSRRYSTKQSHALHSQSTSSRIREMQEEQRRTGVGNLRLFKFFEE